MASTAGAADAAGPSGRVVDGDLRSILPLEIIRSQLVPPAPNRRRSAFDWLPDFGGFSWIAYGASSLLVVSHCPSPLTPEEPHVGPFLKQVIELPPSPNGGDDDEVTAVAWRPSRPPDGQLAAGAGSFVRIFSPGDPDGSGSLRWRQGACLVHSFGVKAIGWTGSGDGIVSVGCEVVLWKQDKNSWEVICKLKADITQDLVSSTWSIFGPVATASSSTYHHVRRDADVSASLASERCVLVCQNDGKCGFFTADLWHPCSVCVIQWRPSSLTWSNKSSLHPKREVLLTCCVDGVVRLWSEIDSGRGRKPSKDSADQKNIMQLYHVIAVIEINHCLESSLGADIFVSWGADIHAAVSVGGDDDCFTVENSSCNLVGYCDWLIAVGPGPSLTFWAIHLLDDVFPLRFPRVNLWKKHDLKDLNMRRLCGLGSSDSDNQSILISAMVSRNRVYAPPNMCSLLLLSHDHSLYWVHLRNPEISNAEGGSLSYLSKGENLSCSQVAVQNQDGHEGKILQIAVHPSCSEAEIAVSLDSHGVLLFWSITTIMPTAMGLEAVHIPSWRFLGRFDLQNLQSAPEYLNLAWAPFMINEDMFLLIGHAEGIDCFLIVVTDVEGANVVCNRMFTISFSGMNFGNKPYQIFAVPNAFNCMQPFVPNKFMLIGISMKEFHVLSWELVMHLKDTTVGTSCSISDATQLGLFSSHRFEYCHAGKTYCVTADLFSSNYPSTLEQVTSFAIPPDNSILSIQMLTSSEDLYRQSPMYHMATGFSNGTLKLWRMKTMDLPVENSSLKCLAWEMVGMLNAHHDPVDIISLTNSGTYVATVCMSDQSSTSELNIWGLLPLAGCGCFSLEHRIPLDGQLVAMSWLELGDGQALLGVCMQKVLRVYSQTRFIDTPVEEEKCPTSPLWSCIAQCHTNSIIKGFLWGPKLTVLLIHENYFSLFSQWSFPEGVVPKEEFLTKHVKWYSCFSDTEQDEDSAHSISSNSRNYISSNLRKCNIRESLNFQQPCYCAYGASLYNILGICGLLVGPLPVYHPKALIFYLYSGKIKRAHMALQHFIDVLPLNRSSSTNMEGRSEEPKYSFTREITLSKYFEAPADTSTRQLTWNLGTLSNISDRHYHRSIDNAWEGSMTNFSGGMLSSTSNPSVLSNVKETLESVQHIAFLNDMERNQMLAVVDFLGELDNQQCSSTYRSFDEPGRRFWVAARFKYFYFNRKFGRLATRNELLAESWMIAWAYQSDSQDNIFNSIISPEPTWTEMRNMGVGYWLTDAVQLRSRMEKLARSQYLLKKDPKDCALLYVALNRLHVLAGLFKLSKDEKDKPLVGFLSRNFQEEKNKAAALKNAYVLLGRHQHELAIAFFLLGQDPSSAIMVCARNLGDEQLALIICCLVEGCGGPLERELITNVLLPNTVDKGDYWLASLLEWRLGNYSKSFKILAESCLGLDAATSGPYNNHAAISDPNIGQYCTLLASKNKLRTSVGDHMAAMLSKWAISTTENALNRCGFPLEALECMSLWFNHNEATDQKVQGHQSDVENLGILHGITNPSFPQGANWLSGDVAVDLECSCILNTAMKYVSKLLLEFPGWQCKSMVSPVVLHKDLLAFEDEEVMENFNTKISVAISFLHQKFSLRPLDIINRILISSYSSGMLFPGYNLLHAYVSNRAADDGKKKLDFILPHQVLPQMLVKAMEEICFFLNRYILYCSFSESVCGSIINENSHSCFYPWTISLSSFIFSARNLRIFIKLYGFTMPKGDFFLRTFVVLDHIELLLSFASAWSSKSLVGLILMASPILSDLNKKESFHEAIRGNITDFLCQILALVDQGCLDRNFFSTDGKSIQHDESGSVVFQFLNEKWQVIGASLWRLLHDFCAHQLDPLIADTLDFTGASKSFEMMPNHFAHSITMSLAYTSSLLRKHLISLLCWKVDQGFHVSNILLLKELSAIGHCGLHYSVNPSTDSPKLTTDNDPPSMLRWLLEVSLHSGLYGKSLNENECLSPSRQKPYWCWSDVQRGTEYETGKNVYSHRDNDVTSSICNGDSDLLLEVQKFDKESIIGSKDNGTNPSKEVTHFLSPKEVYKRSGELIEALCSNCIDEHEVVIASNRKGLVFFNWDCERCEEQRAEYIWSFCDWPHDGWAEADYTSVSPGIDLNTRKGADPGLSGVAINTGPLARPGRDLTGGGAYGIPGYAGIGASGFGWSLQEGLEELMDPPATVDNISAGALSSHPSRPLFLVGSNARAYLWEFGKEKASAAYGTLPSTSELQPVALISALQFDLCGHRFASAAIDGTVCTWQLEVGGRTNVKPMESSLCFNDHACDVAYVGSSGSIIAAAGYSKNDANIILWDTLAPPATSQASIFCHEGGASSLSVFSNGIGCGSMSPIIVTGGRNGDVGLHDFRYIATGRMKRNRHSHEQILRASSASGICENLNGMLWYIERAHLGSVTNISTIPNTSLFLSGSKDGDVKLWDAKRAELVFHWPKLHEKHTFFRSGSRGIGGIIRAAVTDIQVLSSGFLSCGGDGTVKFIQLIDIHDLHKS